MKSTSSQSRSSARSGISLIFLLLVPSLAWAGCAAFRTAAICPSRPSSIVLTALTSPSDIDVSQQAGPAVARQVAQRAANVCATLSTAVADAHPEGDLILTSKELKPTATDAPDRTPWIAELQRTAETWLAQQFTRPLRASVAEPGSPVLTTIAAVAMQLRTAGLQHSTVVEITDGFAEEKAPDGGLVDFEHLNDPKLQTHLQSFVPSLRPLKGGCVILVGAGAHTTIGLRHIDEVRDDIKSVLAAAGVHFAWTRTVSLPPKC